MLATLLAAAVLWGCQGEQAPKQRGYHRIDLPDHHYVPISDKYPYQFEVSTSARVADDTTNLAEPYWIDIEYPEFDADVQITYKALNHDMQRLNSLVEDARKLTAKHQVKASGIEEYNTRTAQGHMVYMFELQGQVPTQFQFFTTDSANHFMRGALYFKTASKNDSLEPVIKYITKDMLHLVQTLHWK